MAVRRALPQVTRAFESEVAPRSSGLASRREVEDAQASRFSSVYAKRRDTWAAYAQGTARGVPWVKNLFRVDHPVEEPDVLLRLRHRGGQDGLQLARSAAFLHRLLIIL